jgi:hypothetical protein
MSCSGSCYYSFFVCAYEGVVYRPETSAPGYNGYLMKGLGLGSKNMLFVFQFSCLFIFCKHKQGFVYILKNAKRSSLWVSNERPRE